jgi:hypothetical protein
MCAVPNVAVLCIIVIIIIINPKMEISDLFRSSSLPLCVCVFVCVLCVCLCTVCLSAYCVFVCVLCVCLCTVCLSVYCVATFHRLNQLTHFQSTSYQRNVTAGNPITLLNFLQSVVTTWRDARTCGVGTQLITFILGSWNYMWCEEICALWCRM